MTPPTVSIDIPASPASLETFVSTAMRTPSASPVGQSTRTIPGALAVLDSRPILTDSMATLASSATLTVNTNIWASSASWEEPLTRAPFSIDVPVSASFTPFPLVSDHDLSPGTDRTSAQKAMFRMKVALVILGSLFTASVIPTFLKFVGKEISKDILNVSTGMAAFTPGPLLAVMYCYYSIWRDDMEQTSSDPAAETASVIANRNPVPPYPSSPPPPSYREVQQSSEEGGATNVSSSSQAGREETEGATVGGRNSAEVSFYCDTEGALRMGYFNREA